VATPNYSKPEIVIPSLVAVITGLLTLIPSWFKRRKDAKSP